MRHLLLLTALLALSACRDVTGPTVSFDQEFTLAPGDQARLRDTSISIAFVGVEGDSRCPADAICIQGGDARVNIRVIAGGLTTSYALHTGDMKPVVDQGLTIALVQLMPYPFSSGPTIKPTDYRVTLKVSK